ncbi:MAG: hypothetical protein ACI959_001094 [Limisphaerales bacterium]|jgi:hypothetical protein
METVFKEIDLFLETEKDIPGDILSEILKGDTGMSSAGYPYISNSSFNLFKSNVPHLFSDGQKILELIDQIEEKLGNKPSAVWGNYKTSARVIRNIIYTAGITAPPDLWLIRQLWQTHREIGTAEFISSGNLFSIEDLTANFELNKKQITADIRLLNARGYLDTEGDKFKASAHIGALKQLAPLDKNWKKDITGELIKWLNNPTENPILEAIYNQELSDAKTNCWIASTKDIELAYLVLPLVLALRATKKSVGAVKGHTLKCTLSTSMNAVLSEAGMLEEGKVTELGARMLSRGPGPYGIIGTYHAYMAKGTELLKKGGSAVWVERGANVFASQLANSKSFAQANNQLDRYCRNHNWKFELFIEHAVGQGEATRQRLERSGEARIQYFGADLEDAAIDRAVEQQSLGLLPFNMKFIRAADIGAPEIVTDYLHNLGLDGQPTVMVVGNGFHEIRNQTNEKMIEVFRGYSKAGFVLIFTEETALEDDDLRNTAWNTYHAGFRYVHEISGQGLRPTISSSKSTRLGWRECAELGGYTVLDEYTYRSRTIYPHPIEGKGNPSISVTYFCVPE